MLQVNKETCTGCGMCECISPEGFEMVDGLAVVKDEKADSVKEATDTCPVKAIEEIK